MVQSERLQVLEQPRAQVVDHPLAGIDLICVWTTDTASLVICSTRPPARMAPSSAPVCAPEGLVAAAIQPGIGRPDSTLSTTSFSVHGVSAPSPTSASDTTASSASRQRYARIYGTIQRINGKSNITM